MIPGSHYEVVFRSQIGQTLLIGAGEGEAERSISISQQPPTLVIAVVLNRTDDASPLLETVNAHPSLETGRLLWQVGVGAFDRPCNMVRTSIKF